MKNMTRKDFLRVCSAGITTLAFQSMTTGTAFADADENKYIAEDIISEMNSWYHENNIPFTLESISWDPNSVISVNPTEMIETLLGVKIDTMCADTSVTPSSGLEPENNLQRAPMIVSFNRTFYHSLSVFLDDGVIGSVNIDINVSGSIDLQYNDVISSSGVAYERNGVNVDTTTLGSVTTVNDSPAKGHVSYSCPCSARFAWTHPNTGIRFTGTANDTFQGSFAAY